jgi:hypothetical protein
MLSFMILTGPRHPDRVAGMRRAMASLGVIFGLVTGWAAEQVPDFQLTDVNANSVRRNSPVSPRDYLLQVTGYYFANAG